MPETADVIVLGLGVGGEDLAGRLAEAGLDVVGIEPRLVGGECPYWGCVPTKMMVRASAALAEARRVPELAGSATVEAAWSPVARRIRAEATDEWDDAVAVERLTGKGGRFVRGTARITGPGTVEVAGTEWVASRGLVIATGTRPAAPPIPGLSEVPYWTNREAVEATTLPGSLAIIGAGAVGCEFAQVFARFGVRVTVIEASEHLLPQEEPEVGDVLAGIFEDDGITVAANATVGSVAGDDDGVRIDLGDGTWAGAERLLVATGRVSDLSGLGVDTIGLDPGAPHLHVDEHLRAGERVWAVGDVTGRGAFTHVAMYQSKIAAADILGEPHPAADYRALPRVTFTDPEVGAVGLTESTARQQGLPVRVGTVSVPATARGWIHKAGNQGLIKLVADSTRRILVGATAAGPAGGEVLGALAVAVHAEVSLDALAQMMYAYPTFHRGIEDALRELV